MAGSKRELEAELADLRAQVAALREWAANFEALAENAVSGILIAAGVGRHVYANQRAAEITGYSVEELLQTEVPDLVHPDELPLIRERYRRRLAGEPVPDHYETVIVRKDGTSRPVEIAPASTTWQGQVADMVVMRDLAEQRQAEESLRESEAKTRALLNAPYEMALLMDGLGTVLAINERGARSLGASVEELLGTCVYDHLPAELATSRRAHLEGVVQSGAPVRFEDERAGMILEHSLYPVFDAQRQVASVAVFARDISERKRAEEALRASEQRYRGIVEDHTELITRFRLDGTLTFVNEALCRYFGRTREEFVGQSFWSGIPEEDRASLERQLAELSAENPIGVSEHQVVAAGGEVRWLQWTNRAFCDNWGRVVECQGVGRDVTERRLAEEALRESERRFREMADLLPDIIYEADTNFRVTYTNHAAYERVGYTRDDFAAGIDVADLLSGEEATQAEARLREMVETGEGTSRVYNIKRADGSFVPYEVHSMVVRGPDGAVVGYRGVLRDVTERRQVEQAQRMAAVGELAAGVAHEFNNILAGMRCWAQAAQALGTPEAQEELVATVLRGSARGGGLCWNLLRFAQPAAPRREPIMIEGPIEAALSMATAELDRAQVEVVRSYGKMGTVPADRGRSAPTTTTGDSPHLPETGVRVYADASQLEQVFLNLIINACHAMPRGGRLTIETAHRAEEGGTGEVVARVSDTGTGIRAESLPRIFEPFFTTKGSFGGSEVMGSGLGLSVSYSIVNAHGGTLAVQSEVGVGAIFEVRLAAYTGSAEAAPAAEPTLAVVPQRGAGRQLLLVEDEAALRDSIGRVLTAEGYQVVAAATAQEALEALRATTFELLILDLILPGGGGREILEAAQRLPQPPPVILMTGKAGENLAQEMLAWGARECLQKPFDLADLLAAVRRYGK